MSALIDILTRPTVTIHDFCAHLQICRRTLLRYRKTCKVPAPDIATGNFVRWLPDTIKKWHRKKNRGK